MNRSLSAIKGVFVSGMLTLGFLAPPAFSGSLEPPSNAVTGGGNPAPTMKTLDEVPPTWSLKLPASVRFELVLGDAAVLDKETGLVWERAPSLVTRQWLNAGSEGCIPNQVGGRYGWQLPTVHQLYSLKDSAQAPRLPAGHPFLNVTGQLTFWSSTDFPEPFRDLAHLVSFGEINEVSGGKNGSYRSWCVRASGYSKR